MTFAASETSDVTVAFRDVPPAAPVVVAGSEGSDLADRAFGASVPLVGVALSGPGSRAASDGGTGVPVVELCGD
jgi:hypothetical protein